MLKKYGLMIGIFFICATLFAVDSNAINFEALPNGICDVVADGYDVVKTGETDDGVVYVISEYINGGNAPITRMVGFSKKEGNIAYDITYSQSSYKNKISFKSTNYYYIISPDSGTNIGRVRKINLNTGGVVTNLAGTFENCACPTYTQPDPKFGGGGWSVQYPTAGGYTVKYIAINDKDKVYVLAKESGNDTNRILEWNGSNWVRVIQTTFPGADLSSEPQGFCAPTSDVFYSAFPGNVYRTEIVTDGIHTKINSGTLPGTTTYMVPGVNSKDMILIYYDTNNLGYCSYYRYASNSFRAVVARGLFNAKHYNLTYLPNTSKISFSYWNGKFTVLAIDGDGVGSWVYLPSISWQQIMNSKHGSGTDPAGNPADEDYTNYNVIGGFGVRTINCWVITKKQNTIVDRYLDSNNNVQSTTTANTIYTMLSPMFPSYWVQQATYIENITSETGTTDPATGGIGATNGSIAATSVFKVVKNVDFIEFVYDKLVDTATTVDGVTATPISVPNSDKKYTKLTGKFTTVDATNPSKAVLFGDKMLIFKIIEPPTNSQTVTLQLSK